MQQTAAAYWPRLHLNTQSVTANTNQERILDFPEGAPTQKGMGSPTYQSAKFSWKLYEDEEN